MSNKIKAYKFTCPDCGGNILLSAERVVLGYPITAINSDGDLDYDLDDVDNDLGDAEVLHYQCKTCGFVPKDRYLNEINRCDKLAEWVGENCPQS